MKLLARILSHGFAIAVVLLLAIGLIYRGELFPEYDLPGFLNLERLADSREAPTTGQTVRDTAEDTGEEADQVITSESVDAVDDGGTATAPEPAPVEADATVQEPAAMEAVQPVPLVAPEVAPAPPESVAEPSETGAETEPEPAAPAPEETRQQPAEEVPAAAATAGEEVAEPTADAVTAESLPEDSAVTTDVLATQPEPETVIPQDAAVEPPAAPQENAYQLLAAAREAYWLRDYDIAESKYLALTRLDPDNPDGYGELGNMYFSQGQWDQAASAYYAAGTRLVGQGLLEQAEELISVIRGLNGANADDLERQISEARSAAN